MYQTLYGKSQSSSGFSSFIRLFGGSARNGVNDQLTTHFADPNWIINQKMVLWLIHYSHIPIKTGKIKTNRFILNSVKSAEDKLRKEELLLQVGG
jgi:hypothetical protein